MPHPKPKSKPKSKKEKYIIPVGTKFGELPKKLEQLSTERVKLSYSEKQWEQLSRYLGLNGFYFEWGYVPVRYDNLEPDTLTKLYSTYSHNIISQGQRIAAQKALLDFQHALSERQGQLNATKSQELRSVLSSQVQSLSALCNFAKTQLEVKVATYNEDDTFDDLFPQTSLDQVNLAELSQDIIELCREYVAAIGRAEGKYPSEKDTAALDMERADLHNRLIDVLREAQVGVEERDEVTTLAERVTKWYGVF